MLVSDLRFLVVDDSVFVRRVMIEMLKGLGATAVETAADGSEALPILARLSQETAQSPDPRLCVLSDVEMPNTNGLALLRAIRTGQAAVPRATPVIMLTGVAEDATAQRATALDVSGFVTKPVSREALRGAIEQAVATLLSPKADAVYAAVEVS